MNSRKKGKEGKKGRKEGRKEGRKKKWKKAKLNIMAKTFSD